MIDLAIVFACFNRKRVTCECLRRISKQVFRQDTSISIYIYDDGSSDGTKDAILEIFPNAIIIEGRGDYFWSKGMNCAMGEAYKCRHEYYLMINDDLEMENNCIQTMIDSYITAEGICGIVGSTQEITGDKLTYGGAIYINRFKVGKYKYLKPNGKLQKCDIANWNCFFISRDVIQLVGLVDSRYEHALGDFDYCKRMSKKNIPIYIATDYIGRTDRNSSKGTFYEHGIAVDERLKRFFSVKGKPFKSELYYYIRNYGMIGMAFFVYTYSKAILRVMFWPESFENG